MCVKDSFVKCWQKPHKPLPSLSSPPTHPRGRQKTPQYGLVLALCHLQHGEAHCVLLRAERGSMAAAGGASTAALHTGRTSETTVCDGVNMPAESTAHNCVQITLPRHNNKENAYCASTTQAISSLKNGAFSVVSYLQHSLSALMILNAFRPCVLHFRRKTKVLGSLQKASQKTKKWN